MRRLPRFLALGLALPLAGSAPRGVSAAETERARGDLVGLWAAKRRFGPEVRGTLTIERDGGVWRAEIAGRMAAARRDDAHLSFELPDREGAFRGELKGGRILGHWIQPRTVADGSRYATPVTLDQRTPGRWRGTVAPLDDAMTFYLPIERRPDGSFGAFLRNPERNAGRWLNVERIAVEGRAVKLFGPRSREKAEEVIAEGVYDPDSEILSIPIPNRGGTFDFRRASASEEAGFYPRGKSPARYSYRPPPADDDGWPVGTLEEAGISREGMTRFVQMLIDMPMDSIHASDIHAVLISRHGKLVLEEYFHGFHRDEPHETRSAAKSLTAVLTGAALLKEMPIGLTTSVSEAMHGAAPADLDPRKRAVTVENLLTMSSGFACDDADPDSPGNEDTMQEQTAQPDWYRFTLDLKMVRAPGEKAVYCSANPNLLGGVLARATGRWLPDLFRELIAEPMAIRRYGMNLTPTGDAYMGGGVRLRPRDFMKVGQIILDGGRWRGRPIVSREFARKSTSPLYELRGIHYGYLWWVQEFPFKGGVVQAFFAGGNGGQVVMGIPKLDLLIAFFGGNYSDPVLFVPQRVFVPEHILPAVN